VASYDLLRSGQFYNDYPEDQIEALLTQAMSLANKIAYVFDTPSGLAATNLNWTSNEPVYGTFTIAATNVTYNSTNTASAGTFILDWFRLSDQSGNQTYRQLTEKGESYLVNPSPAPVYPGLDGTQFDDDTGKMLSFDGGWHAGVDSFLEYLIKTYQYQVTATTTQYKYAPPQFRQWRLTNHSCSSETTGFKRRSRRSNTLLSTPTAFRT